MDFASAAQWVGIAASLALVASVCLLAYNLRATRRDARQNLAFSMMEQLTSEGFAERRYRMRAAVAHGSANGWTTFDDSLEDFESRAFAYQYELIGQMVRSGTLDYRQVRDFLQFTVVSDWIAFDALDAHLTDRYPGRPSPWRRFRELAARVTEDLDGPAIPPPRSTHLPASRGREVPGRERS